MPSWGSPLVPPSDNTSMALIYIVNLNPIAKTHDGLIHKVRPSNYHKILYILLIEPALGFSYAATRRTRNEEVVERRSKSAAFQSAISFRTYSRRSHRLTHFYLIKKTFFLIWKRPTLVVLHDLTLISIVETLSVDFEIESRSSGYQRWIAYKDSSFLSTGLSEGKATTQKRSFVSPILNFYLLLSTTHVHLDEILVHLPILCKTLRLCAYSSKFSLSWIIDSLLMSNVG